MVQADGSSAPASQQVCDTDRDPIVGLAACLSQAQLQRVKIRTDGWSVDAETLCDTMWIRREVFQQCLKAHWLEGRDEMVMAAYFFYDVASIGIASTGNEPAQDSDVDPEVLIPLRLHEFAGDKDEALDQGSTFSREYICHVCESFDLPLFVGPFVTDSFRWSRYHHRRRNDCRSC